MSKMVLLEVKIIHSHILMVLDFVIGETRAKLISVKNVILFFLPMFLHCNNLCANTICFANKLAIRSARFP